VPASDGRARSCPRCGALNGAGFERCVRCAAPLRPLAAGFDALTRGVDASALWGTKVLFALTTLVFLGQLATNSDALARGELMEVMIGSLREILRAGGLIETFRTVQSEPFRLLSAVFVHVNGLHIVLNMLGLAAYGRIAEPGVGTARFVVAYLVTGVVGFAASVAVSEALGSPSFTAGASGAVFGMGGLILGWLYRTRDTRWKGFDRRWLSYAGGTAASLVLVNLLPVRVNNTAHLGGLFCGVAFGIYYAARPKPKSLLVPNLGALLGLLLAVASLVLSQRAAGWGRPVAPPDDAEASAPAGPDAPAEIGQAHRTLTPPSRSPSNSIAVNSSAALQETP
jgi:rhomboid protease GluP